MNTYTQPFNNLFRLAAVVILICGMSIISFSTAFADAHEAESGDGRETDGRKTEDYRMVPD